MEAESPCAASDLAVARRELLSGNHRELDPVGLRQTWLDLHESWLIDKADEIGIADASGFAIVGVGGLGRRELLPYSDLDVLLLHDGKPADILRPVADRLWYPLWDANIRLDHSVRTVSEALTIANSDLMAALGMLEARHIAGDQQLSFALIDGVRRQWRNGIRSRMGELVEMTYARWRRCGRIAQRAEPDLKLGRGGLRDVQLLDALALAQLIDRHGIGHTDLPAGSLDGAYRTLLDVRTELHGCRAADATTCWPSSPTRSAPRWVSVTDSIWRAHCRVLAAPSVTTPKPGCGLRRMHCRGAASRPWCGGQSGDRSTRVSSSMPAKSCSPATPNPNTIPAWCSEWPPRRPTPDCPLAPPP